MAVGTKANIGRCLRPNKSHKLLPKHLWNLHPDVTREVISGRRGSIQTGAEWQPTPSGLVLGPTLNTFFYTDTDGYAQPQNPEGWTLWTYGWHVVPGSSLNANPAMMTLDGSTGGSGGEANRMYFEGDFYQWRGGHFDQFTAYLADDNGDHQGIPVVLLAARVRPSNGKVELVVIDHKMGVSVYEDAGTWAGSFTDDPGRFDFTAGTGAQICGWTEKGLSNVELLELARNPHALFEGPKQFALADPLPQTRVLSTPQVWDRQPSVDAEIDWTNQIAKKLAFLWVGPHTGGEWGRDLVSGVYGVETNANAFSFEKRVTSKGHSTFVEQSASGANHLLFDGVSIDADYHSSYCLYRSDNSNTYWRSTICLYDSGGYAQANITGLTYPISGTSGRIELYDGGLHQSDQWSGYSTGPSDGGWHGLAFEKLYGTINSGKIWIDGGPPITATTQSASAWSGGNVAAVTINSNATWADEGGGYEMPYAAVFTGPLTDAEHKSLHDNPWQVLKKDNLHVPIEYRELTFDEDSEERLFMIPQKYTEQPK